MQFASFAYLAFLGGVVALSLCIPVEWRYARRLLLLTASYVFYASLDWRFVPVLVGVTGVTYAGAIVLGRLTTQLHRRLCLAFCIGALLSSLFIFRYLPRLADGFIDRLSALGLQPDTVIGEWFVPVGISFYTFIGIGYLIDVYRAKVKPERNVISAALFLAFFPQVLSGPIARAAHLLPQIASIDRPTAGQIEEGVALLLRGFAKKLLLADVLGSYLVAPAFDQTGAASAPFLIVGVYAYTLQIYFDLSGYTDLARGAAKLLGLELMRNFDRPYLAASVSEFWTRWHISMSSFFRDYLYFSLGGSKRGNVYLNLVLTFVAIGVWHGAGWNFALYGLLHGGMVALERFARRRRTGHPEHVRSRLIKIALTFHFVVLTRILFREDDLNAAWDYLLGIARWQTGTADLQAPAIALAVLLIGFALVLLPARIGQTAKVALLNAPAWAKSIVIVATVYLCMAVSPGQSAFVYFRF